MEQHGATRSNTERPFNIKNDEKHMFAPDDKPSEMMLAPHQSLSRRGGRRRVWRVKQILLIFAVVALMGGCASTPKVVPNSPEAKAAIEQAIRGMLGKPTGELTEADYENFTFLNLPLNLDNTKITDAGLKELVKLQQLKKLSLHNTKITDAGLKEVAKLKNLTFLDLGGTKITDAGLKEVAKMQNLTELSLIGTKITDAGLKEVAKMQNLTELYLQATQITDAGLKEVAKFKQLKWLSLANTQITDAGLKELVKCKQLSRLYLRRAKVTNAGVAELRKAMPECYIEHFFE